MDYVKISTVNQAAADGADIEVIVKAELVELLIRCFIVIEIIFSPKQLGQPSISYLENDRLKNMYVKLCFILPFLKADGIAYFDPLSFMCVTAESHSRV